MDIWVLLLCVPLMVWLIEISIENRIVKTILRIINTFLTLAWAYVMVMMTFLLCYVGGIIWKRHQTLFVISGCIGIALFIILLYGMIWHVKKKLFYIILGVGIGLTLVFNGILIGIKAYDENIPVLGERNALFWYQPSYQYNQVTVLDEAADISITEYLPVMDGATALYPIYASVANALYPSSTFVNEETEKTVLQCNKTSGAYENIINGSADIIFVASPSEHQKELAKDAGVELVFTPIGREAFVFLVNSKNRIKSATMEQLRKIYSGEIFYWEDLGVKGLGTIKAFQRNPDSGSQTYMEKFMGDVVIKDPMMEEIEYTMGPVVDRVADYKNYKNAIGYSFRFYVTEMLHNKSVKFLAVEGVEPTAENIRNSTYPLTTDFYVVTRKDCSKETKQIVEWLLSDQGQSLIEKVGYVGIK